MEGRLHINVSAVDYDGTSRALAGQLGRLAEMARVEDGFAMTDSEFAFGWHFFVLSVDRSMIEGLSEMMGAEFDALAGKGDDKKFLAWLSRSLEGKSPRFKLALKEEMESSKFGIF